MFCVLLSFHHHESTKTSWAKSQIIHSWTSEHKAFRDDPQTTEVSVPGGNGHSAEQILLWPSPLLRPLPLSRLHPEIPGNPPSLAALRGYLFRPWACLLFPPYSFQLKNAEVTVAVHFLCFSCPVFPLLRPSVPKYGPFKELTFPSHQHGTCFSF